LLCTTYFACFVDNDARVRREQSVRTDTTTLVEPACKKIASILLHRETLRVLARGGGWSDSNPKTGNSVAPDSTESAEQHLIRGEMSKCVRGLIDELPDSYRAVLILSEFEGLTDVEIASVVGATIETVKIRLHRARRLLRKTLVDRCRLYHDEDDRLLCERKVSDPC